jgi:phosphate/sulfate permease
VIGGVLGATLATAGAHAVKWRGLVSKVIVPAGMSPIIAGTVAIVGTYFVYRLTQEIAKQLRAHGFRVGLIASASLVPLAHGTNDAQKTMGVITLALITNGTLVPGAGGVCHRASSLEPATVWRHGCCRVRRRPGLWREPVRTRSGGAVLRGRPGRHCLGHLFHRRRQKVT